jgi:hypothetical protein
VRMPHAITSSIPVSSTWCKAPPLLAPGDTKLQKQHPLGTAITHLG